MAMPAISVMAFCRATCSSLKKFVLDWTMVSTPTSRSCAITGMHSADLPIGAVCPGGGCGSQRSSCVVSLTSASLWLRITQPAKPDWMTSCMPSTVVGSTVPSARMAASMGFPLLSSTIRLAFSAPMLAVDRESTRSSTVCRSSEVASSRLTLSRISSDDKPFFSFIIPLKTILTLCSD